MTSQMPSRSTARLRVILLAPHGGTSGVGDYADDFAAAIRPHVGELIEFRHGAARTESAWGIWRERRRLRALVRAYDDGTPLVVHSEFSGGAVVAFWATLGLRARRSATLHDPPRIVWYPFLTRGVSKGRVLNQAIHRPLHRVLERFERRAVREVDLVVLTAAGARATRALRMGKTVTEAVHALPAGPDTPLPAPSQRPLAVGLFGHVYTGKGFDLLPALRRALPDEIAVKVAGRGTADLAPVPGVEILGSLPEDELASFFGSIRLLLMPYQRPPVGGHEMLPASGTHERSIAFATPSLALGSTTSRALAAEGLCRVVEGGVDQLAAAAADLVRAEGDLDQLAQQLQQHRRAREAVGVAGPFLEVWGTP